MTMPRRASAPVLDRLIVLHIPGPETVDDYGQRIPGPATDYRVWASRQDVTAREQLDLDNDQRLNVHLTKIIIRHRPDVFADQELTDDEGQRRRIIGKAELGRMRHIELLAEAIR